MERLGRFCVGAGLIWVFLVLSAFAIGLATPEEWTPYLDRIMRPEVRRALHLGLTVVVVPIGMISLLRDMLMDPGPLWLKAALPGVFASVYAVVLAAAYPSVGQPLLLMADPVVMRFLPSFPLGQGEEDIASWFVRGAGALAVLAVGPGILGALAGLLAGGSRRH
jgi:hypothetical protein